MANPDFTKLDADEVITFRGFKMTARTAAAVCAKEERANMTAPIMQGGYNPGGVGASGGTHDADGCVDWSVAGMSKRQKVTWVHSGRDVGWCDWHRPTLVQDGKVVWYEHNHGALDKASHASAAAKEQWPDYHNLGNGLYPLVGHDDPDQYRPHPDAEFSYRLYVQGLRQQSRLKALQRSAKHYWRQSKALRRKALARREKAKALRHKINQHH